MSSPRRNSNGTWREHLLRDAGPAGLTRRGRYGWRAPYAATATFGEALVTELIEFGELKVVEADDYGQALIVEVP